MYRVFSLKRACSSGRLLSLIKMSLMSCGVFPGIPARSSRMGFGSLPSPRPAPSQQPSAALRFCQGSSSVVGVAVFLGKSFCYRWHSQRAKILKTTQECGCPTLLILTDCNFLKLFSSYLLKKRDSLDPIKSYIQKLKLPQSIIIFAYLGQVSSKDGITTIGARV